MCYSEGDKASRKPLESSRCGSLTVWFFSWGNSVLVGEKEPTWCRKVHELYCGEAVLGSHLAKSKTQNKEPRWAELGKEG